jgi:hypothetical protein
MCKVGNNAASVETYINRAAPSDMILDIVKIVLCNDALLKFKINFLHLWGREIERQK